MSTDKLEDISGDSSDSNEDYMLDESLEGDSEDNAEKTEELQDKRSDIDRRNISSLKVKISTHGQK